MGDEDRDPVDDADECERKPEAKPRKPEPAQTRTPSPPPCPPFTDWADI